MEGKKDSNKNYGIIPNSFAHVFLEISKASKDVGYEIEFEKKKQKNTNNFRRYLVNVSYLEIYNEEVRDLLSKDHEKNLEVKIIYFDTNNFDKLV